MRMASKIKLIVIGLILTPLTFAAKSVDPCNEIPGSWAGTWQLNRYCIWNMEAKGTKYNDEIRLQVKLSLVQGRCDKNHSFVLVGTCKDSKVKVSEGGFNLTGSVFSGFMNLSDKHTDIQLNKKS